MAALPTAPTAWAASSGHSPGVGPSPGRFLASSCGVAASPPVLLASQVAVAALDVRQLAGQPKRRRYGLWHRHRRRLHRVGRLCRSWPGWYNRFQPRTLVGWLCSLAADDVGHHLHGDDSGGVGGEVHPIAGPDTDPVYGGQILQWRLERTKEFQYIKNPGLCRPFACCSRFCQTFFGSGDFCQKFRILAV
jgi:hypothetical protein